MTRQDSLMLIQARLGKRNAQKKTINILVCLAIVFLGITATIYKVRYEGGFWTCFHEMTVCATVLTTITSAALVMLNLYEMKIGSEQTSTALYYWRLSSAVTEMIVLLIVLIGFLPFFSDHPVIGRYDMINMHVIILLLTVGSFLFLPTALSEKCPRKTA